MASAARLIKTAIDLNLNGILGCKCVLISPAYSANGRERAGKRETLVTSWYLLLFPALSPVLIRQSI